MKAIAVIPARLDSKRLPRKVLREIAGRPMLAHVYEAASSAGGLEQVIVATDSEEVMEVCRKHGWTAQMTSSRHTSGTERVNEVADVLVADVYINVQGDEPLARPEHIRALLGVMQDPEVQVGTLKTRAAGHDVANPNAVKVVTDNVGRALYFSRSTIPFDRDGIDEVRYFKHLGFYAYRRPALKLFCSVPETELERAERLEQLRFLANGVAIQVAETPFDTIGVDTEDDLRRADQILRSRG